MNIGVTSYKDEYVVDDRHGYTLLVRTAQGPYGVKMRVLASPAHNSRRVLQVEMAEGPKSEWYTLVAYEYLISKGKTPIKRVFDEDVLNELPILFGISVDDLLTILTDIPGNMRESGTSNIPFPEFIESDKTFRSHYAAHKKVTSDSVGIERSDLSSGLQVHSVRTNYQNEKGNIVDLKLHYYDVGTEHKEVLDKYIDEGEKMPRSKKKSLIRVPETSVPPGIDLGKTIRAYATVEGIFFATQANGKSLTTLDVVDIPARDLKTAQFLLEQASKLEELAESYRLIAAASGLIEA